MCSIEGDIEELNLSCSNNDTFTSYKKPSSTTCRKCGEPAIVLLQKKDAMCKLCFNAYFYHKFKSCIGKSKVIRPGSKVLIACSGGSCSSTMLHMVKQALDDASHKKLLFTPGVLYINESFLVNDKNYETCDDITNIINSPGYPTLYSSLEMVFRSEDRASFYANCPSKQEVFTSSTLRTQLCENLKNIKSLSSKHEYLECLRFELIKGIAKNADYTHIFVGDSATNLAIRLLSNLAMGKGAQTSFNTAFCDQRSEISVCRPMREFLKGEISWYNHLNDIPFIVRPTILTMTDFQSSIQRLTEKFVCGLQEDFPATIFTIFRTSGKLSTAGTTEESEKCIMCDSPKDNVSPDPCSALEALSLSAELSNVKTAEVTTDDIKSELNIENFLCHGCSIIFREVDENLDVPYSFTRKLSSQDVKSQMYEQIKEFILLPETS